MHSWVPQDRLPFDQPTMPTPPGPVLDQVGRRPAPVCAAPGRGRRSKLLHAGAFPAGPGWVPGSADGVGCDGRAHVLLHTKVRSPNSATPLPCAGVAAICLPAATPSAVCRMILQVACAGEDPAQAATLAALLDGVAAGLGYASRHGLLCRLLRRQMHSLRGEGLSPERVLRVLGGLGVDARDALALDLASGGAWTELPDALQMEVRRRASEQGKRGHGRPSGDGQTWSRHVDNRLRPRPRLHRCSKECGRWLLNASPGKRSTADVGRWRACSPNCKVRRGRAH